MNHIIMATAGVLIALILAILLFWTLRPQVYLLGKWQDENGYSWWDQSQAISDANSMGLKVAPAEQFKKAYSAGANVCAAGWLQDTDLYAIPIQTDGVSDSCAPKGDHVTDWRDSNKPQYGWHGKDDPSPGEGGIGVWIYGVKPSKWSTKKYAKSVHPFNDGTGGQREAWYQSLL